MKPVHGMVDSASAFLAPVGLLPASCAPAGH
jgi:hypothetical protein